jgi:hypothetical protein
MLEEAARSSRAMFSLNSATNLKIVGTEGHNADTIREAVGRGGRFVIYSYNFSLVVLSFKRPSSIYFVPAGQSRVWKGLPFTLISLVFGWWGIPWGVIYTIQSLHTNLSGGTDVTDSILAGLAPAAAGAAPAPSPPIPARPPLSMKRLALVGAVVASLIAAVYVSVCFFYGRHLPVAIVSGTSQPYSIELNGQAYRIVPRNPVKLDLAEGDFVLHGAPGAKADLRFTVQAPFFSRPFARTVLVVNPDRAAVVYREQVKYHSSTSPADPNEKNDFAVFANHEFYSLAEPDYFFEPFPEKISMPSGTGVTTKSRLDVFAGLPLDMLASLVSEKLGADALREFLGNQARVTTEDETLQRLLMTSLKPAEARTIFEAHLDDRPTPIEWHRAYQFLIDSQFPAVDLRATYRKRMEANPDEGAWTYLYARLLHDPAEAYPYYQKALQVAHPTPYASYALATDAFADGQYSESLALLAAAERAGLHNETLRRRKRETLLALGRVDDVLAEIRAQRNRDPLDAEAFVDELMLTLSRQPDRTAGLRATAEFAGRLRARHGSSNSDQIDHFLASRLAYGLGKEAEFADHAAKLRGPLNAFEAALARRDHAAAAKALGPTSNLPARYSWLLMLAAHAAGDAPAADVYFQQGLTSLEHADSYSRTAAKLIAEGGPNRCAELLRLPNYADELRVFFTALGVHFPADRAAYFKRAAELDRDPAFPHLLLQAVRGMPASGTRLTAPQNGPGPSKAL